MRLSHLRSAPDLRWLLPSALLFAACAHRMALTAPAEAHGLTGVPLRFGDPQEPVPEGTKVHWAFGDGAEADGPVVTHAFGRAGSYTTVETVTDSRGPR